MLNAVLKGGKNGWTHDDGTWKSTSKTWTQYAIGRHAEKSIIDAVSATSGTTADPANMYGATTSPYFMDDWTIFYWGWWISWAPFVGMFIARISRGRTVGQLIKGAFIAPVLFGFFYLTVLGSLGIKMQRVAELALGNSTYVDWSKGSGAVDCERVWLCERRARHDVGAIRRRFATATGWLLPTVLQSWSRSHPRRRRTVRFFGAPVPSLDPHRRHALLHHVFGLWFVRRRFDLCHGLRKPAGFAKDLLVLHRRRARQCARLQRWFEDGSSRLHRRRLPLHYRAQLYVSGALARTAR